MNDSVSIAGLDKAEVLKALWDDSRAQGMSFLGLPSGGAVTIELCREAIDHGEGGSLHAYQSRALYFDYWHGHVLKVDLSGDEFDPWLYDRDNGDGAASRAVTRLREGAAA